MMKKYFYVGLAALSLSHFAFADDAALLQQKLNLIHTMTANFSQQVKADKRPLSRSTGRMAISRPGLFRWQVDSPMKQLLVADGKRLWIYDVELEQVTVKKQRKKLGGTAALFLSDYDRAAAEQFQVQMKTEGNEAVFDLKAKSAEPAFQKIRMVFSGQLLKTITLFDQLGQRTELQFSQIKLNPKLPSNLFSFKAPKSVDLVEQ